MQGQNHIKFCSYVHMLPVLSDNEDNDQYYFEKFFSTTMTVKRKYRTLLDTESYVLLFATAQLGYTQMAIT